MNAANALLQRIALGEDSLFELNELRFSGQTEIAPHRAGLADELAAFANARGGSCLLGIEDVTRRIAGIAQTHLDTVETFVREICNDSIEPPLVASIEKLMLPSVDGTPVAVVSITIPQSLFVHRSPGGYLHRIGSSKREMAPDYLARLFQQRSQARLIRFDEQPVHGASLDDLVPSLWERFRTPRSQSESRESLLHKLGMAYPGDGGIFLPSVAGVLLASSDPRRFLPNAFIQAVAYRGTDAVPPDAGTPYQLDSADISGPIDEQVMTALAFVARNMKVRAYKSLGRKDVPQFDLTAVFEALVNAVAHRDYAVYGSKIRLRVFADRLELFSPGPLSNTMTVESLPLRQSARNEAITSLLSRCPVPSTPLDLHTGRYAFMDKRGEGVGIILERSEALSGRRPEYRVVDDAELMLTLWASNDETVQISPDRREAHEKRDPQPAHLCPSATPGPR